MKRVHTHHINQSHVYETVTEHANVAALHPYKWHQNLTMIFISVMSHYWKGASAKTTNDFFPY
jgi:hypothetical protein